MTDEDLIARLRMIHEWVIGKEAANRMATLVADVARLREALNEAGEALLWAHRRMTGPDAMATHLASTRAYRAALADTAPQSTALDDKIGADAVAKAAKVLLAYGDAVGLWTADECPSISRSRLRAIGEASHE